jgi:phospholipase C
MRHPIGRAALLLGGVALALLVAQPGSAPAAPDEQGGAGAFPIQNVVIIYLENRSFDHLFGLFPGANGLRVFTPGPAGTPTPLPQRQLDGTLYATFPPPGLRGPGDVCAPDPRLPPALYPGNAPWQIPTALLAANLPQVPAHVYYRNQYQIDGGTNALFVAWDGVPPAYATVTTPPNPCAAGALVMGYWGLSSTFLWSLAREYTLADNFFQGAFGGSWFNHMWLVCACTPLWVPPPGPAVRPTVQSYPFADRPAFLQDWGGQLASRATDDYAVNTLYPPFPPVPPPNPTLPAVTAVTFGGPPATPVPGAPTPTAVPARHIGNLLDRAGKSWAYYAQGYATGAMLSQNHLPFNFFPNPAATPQAAQRHLKDYTQSFAAAARSGTLENVVWVKPDTVNSMHPAQGSITQADAFVREVMDAITAGPQWARGQVAVIITWDENGGFYDHVAPPPGDQWGPGSRIPTLIISPWARRGFVDHTLYDTTSTLKFVEAVFGLPALGGERPNVGNLFNAFTVAPPHARTATPLPARPPVFGLPPWLPPPLPPPVPIPPPPLLPPLLPPPPPPVVLVPPAEQPARVAGPEVPVVPEASPGWLLLGGLLALGGLAAARRR